MKDIGLAILFLVAAFIFWPDYLGQSVAKFIKGYHAEMAVIDGEDE